MKSSVDQIRERFDQDVERFSNLETGQAATVDARLCMELVAQAAAATTPQARDLLDIGCGAGNYTLMMLAQMPPPRSLNCTLVDLSRPMLDCAVARVSAETAGRVTALQGDMRELEFAAQGFDGVLAAATLHHLRTDDQWRDMFKKIFDALRPGGSFWIFDMVDQASPAVQELMRRRYAGYLQSLQGGGAAGKAYQEHVFAYIEQEDTPRTLGFQWDLLRATGFRALEILHKNSLFAAFGARRPPV